MSDKKFDDYKDKFLQGALTPEEEEEFKQLICENPNEQSMDFQALFTISESQSLPASSPFSKETFFQKIESNQKAKRKRTYWIAASLIGILLFAAALFFQQKKAQKSMAQAEVDRSLEITKMALNSISTHLETGLKKAEKGMDFSMPYKSLSHLNKPQK